MAPDATDPLCASIVLALPEELGGAERLRTELDRLKSEDRPKIIAAIAEARAHGDLKENAEYHAAREQPAEHDGGREPQHRSEQCRGGVAERLRPKPRRARARRTGSRRVAGSHCWHCAIASSVL